MGAEGKYDLKLSPNFDPDIAMPKNLSASSSLTPTSPTFSSFNTSTMKTIAETNTTDTISAKGSLACAAFASRKSSSTSSLLEPSSSGGKITVACTEQAASADSLIVKKAAQSITETVLTRARTDILAEPGETVISVGLSPTQEEPEELENERPITPNKVDDRRSSSSNSSSKTNIEVSTRTTNANTMGAIQSVSVPNLSINANMNDSTVSLLETFAAVARRRAGSNVTGNSTNVLTSNTGNSLLSRGSNNVCSLVRLALSSNFPREFPGN